MPFRQMIDGRATRFAALRAPLVLAGAMALLSACAITPRDGPAGPTCGFTRYQLKTPTPGSNGVDKARIESDASPTLFAAAIEDALAPGNAKAFGGPSVDPALLFLSGGSQHGAYGAGYLGGWRATSPTGHLPRFAVVTGISTGAILSTFAFTDRSQDMERAYSILNERELLNPLVSVRNGAPTIKGYVGLIRKGAIADLAPLRKRLLSELTDPVLADVAEGARQHRLLVVGVVDIDTGGALALDLTKMAGDQQKETDPNRREILRGCFADAIVASSSAPMAALPVFIDHRMYVDGGARFGAFSDELGPILDRRNLLEDATPLKIYLIVNGEQTTPSRCGRLDRTKCPPPGATDPEDPTDDLTDPHAKWGFLPLALRSESILSNQVYRFSAESIANIAWRRGMKLLYTQIDSDAEMFPFDLDAELGGGRMTCSAAWKEDKRLLDPIQFYPRYMRCLIAYGRSRAAADRAAGRLS